LSTQNHQGDETSRILIMLVGHNIELSCTQRLQSHPIIHYYDIHYTAEFSIA